MASFTLATGVALSTAFAAFGGDRAAEQKQSQLQVQAVFERLIAANNAGDAAALSKCYEGEGLLLPPSGPPVRGQAEIRKRYEAVFAGTKVKVNMKSEELWVLDDWALSRGVTTGSTVSKASGASRRVHDKYLMVLKRDGDIWVIHNLMWNPMG
ncbi:MAG: SgcJ/EcaC family oxidoreductase [Vicinamibacteria bacterium]